MRASHPVARRPFTFETFLAQEYVKQSMSPTDMRFVDNVLTGMGHKRRITLNVPHWLVVPHVLKQTDLLIVMPGRLAAALNDDGLLARDLPFEFGSVRLDDVLASPPRSEQREPLAATGAAPGVRRFLTPCIPGRRDVNALRAADLASPASGQGYRMTNLPPVKVPSEARHGEVAPSYGDGGGKRRGRSLISDHDLELADDFDWCFPPPSRITAPPPV